MLFNSLEYIFLFLPLIVILYAFLIKRKLVLASKILLVFSSLFFYGYWNPKYLTLLLISVIINYSLGLLLTEYKKKFVAIVGILFNIFLLGYFKYANFFIENIATLFDSNFGALNIILPLAISFFTFQQIAYIIDCYQGKVREKDFLNYTIFVTFFPQLIAGPIVHHKEMMSQFAGLRTKFINHKNIATGLFIFAAGLFKKVMIADYLSVIANHGFSNYELLSLFDAWKTSLAYTFQLYFDFSGYTDMAIGSALMFNIKLPFNFNQPYKSLNIQDFWNRWHMTLSRFLKEYIYIPLGGSRVNNFRIYTNLMIVFLVSGLWHGAGWTFIFWGFLHGSAICINRFWSQFNIKINKILAWFITFHFLNISWVFFRAESLGKAVTILQKMFGFNVDNLGLVQNYDVFMQFIRFNSAQYVFFGLFLVILYLTLPIVTKDAEQLKGKFTLSTKYAFITAIFIILPALSYHKTSEFLYFNF